MSSASRSSAARNIRNIPLLETPVVDIGANLTSCKQAEHVMQRAEACNVHIVITGSRLNESKTARQMCQRNPDKLTFTAGIHPHYVEDALKKETADQLIEQIKQLAESTHCVAIGETGLDFNRNYSDPKMQIEMCKRQVALACELQKPLFMHEREAHVDFMKIMHEFRERLPRVVVHCFTGPQAELATYIKEGFYIGVAGTILHRNRRGRALQSCLAAEVPLERLMMETDAPFMGFGDEDSRCADFGRMTNEPCVLPIVAEAVAHCYGVDAEHIARVTTENSQLFFQRHFGVDTEPASDAREISATSHSVIDKGPGKGRGKGKEKGNGSAAQSAQGNGREDSHVTNVVEEEVLPASAAGEIPASRSTIGKGKANSMGNGQGKGKGKGYAAQSSKGKGPVGKDALKTTPCGTSSSGFQSKDDDFPALGAKPPAKNQHSIQR